MLNLNHSLTAYYNFCTHFNFIPNLYVSSTSLKLIYLHFGFVKISIFTLHGKY